MRTFYAGLSRLNERTRALSNLGTIMRVQPNGTPRGNSERQFKITVKTNG